MPLELKINPDRTIQVDAMAFDLDGTLVDSDDFWMDICCEALGGYGVAIDPVQRLNFSGKGNLHSYCKETFGLRVTRKVWNQKMWEIFYSVPNRSILAMEGAIQTVQTFAALLPLALVTTNRTDYAESVLESLGMSQYFPVIVGGDQVRRGRGKPKPDVYIKALKKLNADRSRAVGVEDSFDGAASVKSAGMFCIVVPNKSHSGRVFPEADLVVPNLLEINNLIKTA